MEWRIIVPVLCLIGIIHVPGNAAQANTNTSIEHRFSLRFSIIADFQSEYSNIASNAAIQLKSNITSQVEPVFKANYTNFLGFNISQFSNGSIVTDGELQFSNGSKPNVTDLTQILTNANITIKINTTTIKIIDLPQPPATTPAAPTTPTTVVPAKISKINLVFKIIQDFKESYSNLSHPETIELTNNITTGVSKVYKNRFPKFHRMTIQKFSQGSIVADSILEFDSTNGSSVPNASQVKDTLTEAIASNQLSFKVDNTSINATVIPDTTATTVSAASSLTEYNITFKMNEIFSNDLSNRTSAAAIKLATNVTTELDNFFKAFTNFNRSVVLQFRNGSIVVDGQLGFNKNGNNPAVGDLAKGLAAAVRAGIVKLTIDPKSITITDPTGQVATTPAAPSTTTTVAPAKVSKINLVFKIIQDFKEAYSNLNLPETIELTNNITTGVSKVYKNRFPNFHRMTIQKFSQGSIVADSVLEFDSTNGSSVPNASQVKDTLTEAIASNQLSFKVDNTSINATVIPDTTATTVSAASSLTEYNITFKMNEIFSNDLSNRTSAAAIKLATNVTTELDNFFKAFTNFNRSVVLQFRNGSIVVDGQLGFNKNGNNPAVGDLAKGLAAAVRAGIVKLTIDPKSITITDPTGQVANRSPVLASMLTALWMTLASLLLSAVMH